VEPPRDGDEDDADPRCFDFETCRREGHKLERSRDFRGSLKWYKKSLKAAEQTGDHELEADALCRMGQVYESQRNIAAAV
jgi:hypothetical protein